MASTKGRPKTPGSGRVKGTPNKVTTKILNILLKAGVAESTPLSQMMKVQAYWERRVEVAEARVAELIAQGEADSEDVIAAQRMLEHCYERLGGAAERVAPFIHAKLSTTTVKQEQPFNHKIEIEFIGAEDGRPLPGGPVLTIDPQQPLDVARLPQG